MLRADSLERCAEELGRGCVGRWPEVLGRAAVRPRNVVLCARRGLHAGAASRRGSPSNADAPVGGEDTAASEESGWAAGGHPPPGAGEESGLGLRGLGD
ncbi:hypothetical protein NDU88_007838 [Pleurodeles waltl]|uniref:Uncharacterized protein n=1 Tax=Pleurodeles waltl TaxID=8319 RepID=A0AAV7PV14_PLEWA|nr:hypothetical protein NDU88_007838 [Pleurodeles waltl]